MVEWFEDDEFWSTWYPYMFTPERMERAPEEVDQILDLIGFEPSRILDLACGPGRHTIEFAKRGYRVTGVDRSPFLLSRARGRAAAAGVEVEWIQRDMREFERPQAFDLAINMFTAFGYFDDKSEDLRVLSRLWASLTSGGALLIDVISKEWLARHFEATSSSEREDGSMVVNRKEIFDDWTRMRNEWILIQSGEARSFKFHHTIYSGQELRERLEATGFQGVELYGDLEGNPYGIDAERLVAVARK
jgi:SAM-dependent methyltransferase